MERNRQRYSGVGESVMSSSREIYCLRISVVPDDYIEIYPFTSRILKSIAIQKILRNHKDLILSRDRYKPLFISMLSNTSGRRMYSLYNAKPQRLRQGEKYYGRICFSPREHASIDPELEGKLITPFGEMLYHIDSIEMHTLENLGYEGGDRFYVELITPALLSSKIVSSGNGDNVNVKRELFRIPTPDAIIAYSLKLWNTLAPPEHRLPRPCDDQAARRYEALIAVKAAPCIGTDFAEMRSVVIETGRRINRAPKTDTGFEGRLRFLIACEKIEAIARKTLALIHLLGLGRGRGIGLGEASIKTTNHREKITNQLFISPRAK